MRLTETEHIIVHGFIEDEGVQQYCFVNDFLVTGFTVYRRFPIDSIGTFDTGDERDFETYDEAKTYAELLADGRLEIVIE